MNQYYGAYHQIVLNALEMIESALCDDISVTDIAMESGLSSWYFQRIFRIFTGETIGTYLRKRRLTSAALDLKNNSLKVIDVAIKYQFNSSEAFSRAFKAEFGFSPVQFKERQKSILPFYKATIDKDRLRYLSCELVLEPEIRTIGPIHVVGIPVSFVSPFLEALEYMESADKAWKTFNENQKMIPEVVQNIKVGLIQGSTSSRHHIHDNMVDYLACTPISSPDISPPPGFVVATIPGGTYAVFTATGYHKQTQYIIDHVYTTWLPSTKYKRTEGAEFTWLDHRFSPLDPMTSKVEYFLPIK